MKDREYKEIISLDMPELAPYTERSENRLYRWNEPSPGLFIAESMKVLERALNAGYVPVSVLSEEGCVGSLPELPPGCPVYAAPHDVIMSITGYEFTGGVLGAMLRRGLRDIEEVLAGSRRIAVLQRVTNPTNVGAIVRCAAALSLDAVIFTDGCADPLGRRAIRTGMGCIFQMPWTEVQDPEEVFSHLENAGFASAALALGEKTASLGEADLGRFDKLALFLGNEGHGLPVETVQRCALSLKIPMREGVDSLNVAAASAIAFWELRRAGA